MEEIVKFLKEAETYYFLCRECSEDGEGTGRSWD